MEEEGLMGAIGSSGPAWRLKAQLVGGVADGYLIQLPELSPEILVYVEGGKLLIEPGPVPGSEVRSGMRYCLVEPVGPDVPVYVGASTR